MLSGCARITQDEVATLTNSVVLMTYLGFMLGGVGGLKPAAAAHIEANKNTKYVSALHAQQDLNNATFRGFIRRGASFSWKVAAFTALFRYMLSIPSICSELLAWRTVSFRQTSIVSHPTY